MTLPPESRLPRLLIALWMQRDPLGFFLRCQQRHGDVFVLTFGTGLPRNAWVCHPALAAQVMAAPAEQLEAARANAILQPIVGEGSLLLLLADAHAQRRALLAPEFDPGHEKRDRQVVTEIAARHVASLPMGSAIDLWEWARALTMEIMLRVVFGVGTGPRSDALAAALSELVDLSGSPAVFFSWMRPLSRRPQSSWRRLLRCHAKVQRLIVRLVAECRADPNLARRDDLIALAVRAKYADGRVLTNREICDEAITLMIAGKETAAGGLAWTIDLLLRNGSELARVRDELRKGNGDWLYAAVMETLRLRVPLFGIGRGAVKDYRLGPFTIPAGMGVAVPLLLVYRSPLLFDQPTRFMPQRYLAGGGAWPDWVPFGDGVRKCIGLNFAPMLIETVLREIIERVELALADESAEGMQLRGGALVVAGRKVNVLVAGQHAPAASALSPAVPGSR